MKIYLTLVIILISSVSISQIEKVEALLMKHTWDQANDTIIFIKTGVLGSDGERRLRND